MASPLKVLARTSAGRDSSPAATPHPLSRQTDRPKRVEHRARHWQTPNPAAAAASPAAQGGESPPPALQMSGPRPIDIEFKDIKYVVKDRATGRPLEILKGVSGKVLGDGLYRRSVGGHLQRPRQLAGLSCLLSHSILLARGRLQPCLFGAEAVQ